MKYREWLQQHIIVLEIHLIRFEQITRSLKNNYEKSLTHISDPVLRSRLMETYTFNINRQEKNVEEMRQLYQKAIQQLEGFEK